MIGANAITVINNARTMDDTGVALLLVTLIVMVIVIAFLEWRRRRRGRPTITAPGHGLEVGDLVTWNPGNTVTPAEDGRFVVVEVTDTTFTIRRLPSA